MAVGLISFPTLSSCILHKVIPNAFIVSRDAIANLIVNQLPDSVLDFFVGDNRVSAGGPQTRGGDGISSLKVVQQKVDQSQVSRHVHGVPWRERSITRVGGIGVGMVGATTQESVNVNTPRLPVVSDYISGIKINLPEGRVGPSSIRNMNGALIHIVLRVINAFRTINTSW
jgi:hypothetical protein